MAMRRIAHAAYNISNIDAAIHYYCDLLGMEKLFTLPLGDGRTLLYLRFSPAQFLELFYGASADQTPHGNTGSFEHLCIEVDNIADMYDDFVKRGVPVVAAPSEGSDGNIQMWLVDPFGNRIELMQYGAHPLQFPEN